MIESKKLSKESVEKLIAENYNTYKSISRITSDYRGEKALTDAYNGRQLLEMLQNADDAQTDNLLLQINTENNILTIANNGKSFDSNGIASLMLANNSPKNKRDFIGNKGLGFRSILNWVDVIKIKTRDYILEFSKEIASRHFELLVPDIQKRQQIIDLEKDLAKGEIPFAILAIPDFKENTENQDWETIIELTYKKNEESNILEQLKTITPEVLLFLNHTMNIKILGAGILDKELVFSPSKEEVEKIIKVNDITWNIFDSGENSLPYNKDNFFNFKIAWQDDLSDTETMFATYFPTQVTSHLPYLIHATFDLDPSRNHLNKSDDNDFILNQIASTLKEIAIKEIVNDRDPDWRAFDFLTVNGKSENRLLDTFFQNIEDAKTELAIYPTLDGNHRTINEIKYYGNDFSKWVQTNKLEEYFPNLILPIPSNHTLIKFKINSKYSIEEWRLIFEIVTHKIESIGERVKLIKLLNSDLFKDFHGIHLPLLLDDKGKPVSSDYETYILKRADTDSYQIQDYVKIAFIDGDFYSELENTFNDEIERIRSNPKEHKSRALKKIISPIVNFGSNDITDVVRNITRAFNSKIEEDASKTQELVKPFINSLFQIFKQKKEGEKTTVDNIQVLNRENKLVLTTDVFLGKEYNFGKITEKLFDGIYKESQYLIGNEFWNLDIKNQSADYLDSFFLWLGVNKYSKLKNINQTVTQWGGFDEFSKFIFQNIGIPELCTTVKYEIEKIDFFDEIISKKMSLEKLIAWIILDEKTRAKIDYEFNNEIFTHSYGNITKTITSKPSYFLYQIAKAKIFENVFIDFEFADFLGLQSVNPKHFIFIEFGIADTAVIDTLKKLSAKMSFDDLTNESVYALLETLKVNDIDSKNARKVYQQAFGYFRNNKKTDYKLFKKQRHLLAVKNNLREYKPTEEVYYSDNSTLPSKIIEDFWIFDFPKRSGEKQLAEYFGVKTFKDINIEIKQNISYHLKIEEFNGWFDKIKPYLLSYRLNNIKTIELTNTAVNAIKTCSIKIVSSLDYTIDGNEPKSLLPNEFINKDKHMFFIGANANLNLEQLKDIPAFCEAFSEILCVLFEINENKDDFRAIFKDKEHLKDTKYLIETKMLTEKYEEACQLLGLSKNEALFWKTITEGKINDFPETLSNTTELQAILRKTINYELPEDYGLVNFDFFNNRPSYNFIISICNELKYTLEELKLHLESFSGLYYWHLEKFKQVVIDVEILWNKAFWFYLSDKSTEEQKTFESKRNLYIQKSDKILYELAEQFAWTIEVSHEEQFLSKLKLDFKITIQKENLEVIIIENKYKQLIKENDISIEDLSLEIRSLLFFEGHEELLRTKFEEITKKELEETENPAAASNDNGEMNSIITSIDMGNVPTIKTNRLGNKRGSVHSQKREQQKQKAGKRAEKKVFDKLKKLYPEGEIRWISSNSEENSITLDDTKGYDMSYKKNKTDTQWKYLEVKSSTGNSFIISNNEVSVGIDNKENYHLALVSGYDIYFVEDFFLNVARVSEFNTLRNSASIRPLDFEVYYKLEKL